MTPTVSVVIPSIGRTDGVRAVLEAIAPGDDTTEVIVVDNTADRASGLDALATHSVRVVHEPNAGAARARNRGVAEARGRVVVFVDDDIRIRPDTAAALAGPVLAGTAVAAVGRVVLDPGVSLPRWLSTPWLGLLSRYDRGDEPHDLDADDHGLTAAMAVDRDRFEAVGGFWERLGPHPGVQRTNDDVQLCRALHRDGGAIAYLPAVTVVHDLPTHRRERRYLLRRSFEQGRSDWVLEHGWEHRGRREVVAEAWRDLLVDQRGNLGRFRELHSLPMRVALSSLRFVGVVAAAFREPEP